jgi:RNA polymerase sigma-54 factor
MSKINQNFIQKQTQSLLLKPKMLQSLEMLTLPMMELETYLKQEMIENPMLELVEDQDEDDNNDNDREEEKKEEEQNQDDDIETTLRESEELSEILDAWNDINEEHYEKISHNELPNLDQMANVIEKKRDDFILSIEISSLAENEKQFALDMVDSVNDYGYLPEDYDIESTAAHYDIEPERAYFVHQFVLNLPPKGITARNCVECLLAQLSEEQNESLIRRIIAEDFDDLIHKRYKKIASKYNVTFRTIINYREQIGKLDPKPGLRLFENKTNYITPDVIVKRIGNDFEVFTNDFAFPRIRMSRRYINLLTKLKQDKNAVNYVREKVNSAKFLIKSIYMRGRTLERVTKAIIKHQTGFFYGESGVLEPLKYSTIAEELSVNESTISRVVRDKYADTPFGIICLKDFFSSTAGKDDDYKSVSRQNVETMIRRMIQAEDKNDPLSDQDISDRLKEEGMNVSRRVISKYRKALDIPNSNLRRIE